MPKSIAQQTLTWAVLGYIGCTVLLAIPASVGSLLSGVAWLAGTALATGGAIGLHGMKHPGVRSKAGVVLIASALIAVGWSLANETNVSVFGIRVIGDHWVALGALAGASLALATPVITSASDVDKKRDTAARSGDDDIIAAYARVLEERAGETVSDVSVLPAPKAVLDAALRKSIGASHSRQEIEVLKAAFVMLADFQEGVPEEDACLVADIERIRASIASSGQNAQLLEDFSRIAERQSYWLERTAKEGEARLQSVRNL